VKRESFLAVVSGPSGSGKSTVIKRVMEGIGGIWLSVSATTRPPRPGEVNGLDYIFLSEEEFLEGIERCEFVEWARVFGHYYGTPKKPLLENLARGIDVLLEIDTQGARQIRKGFGARCTTVFIAPPSLEELAARLSRRGTEDEGQVLARLEAAKMEMREGAGYDYWVVNERVEEAALDIISIIRAERCRRSVRFW